MKYFKFNILAICMVAFSLMSLNSHAQKGVIITKDLSTVSSANGTKIGFPWNGCHSFEVQIGTEPVIVTTTVTICCVYGLCNPMFGQTKNQQLSKNGKLNIVESSAIDYGGYLISLVPGSYTINQKREISDLFYKLVPKG